MSIWDRLRALLGQEAREVEDAIDDATARGNEALDRRARELGATPEEPLAIERERAEPQDAEYEALRRKIEGDDT
jgi:hypothetical protein